MTESEAEMKTSFMNFVNWQLELEIHNLLLSSPHFRVMLKN
jgi:hypothetical protein